MKFYRIFLLLFALNFMLIGVASISLGYQKWEEIDQIVLEEKNQNYNLPNSNWSESERFVWEKISAGEIANFNELYSSLTPSNSESWKDRNQRANRCLRSSFIETIMLCEKWQNRIPHQGINIIGALFEQDLNLQNTVLKHNLRLEKCRFEKGIYMKGMKASQGFSLADSAVYGEIDLSGTAISGDLKMDNGKFNEVIIRCAEIYGQLLMNNASFEQRLFMPGTKICSQFEAKQAVFKSTLVLNGSRINGQLTLENANAFKEILMYGMCVERRLTMSAINVSGPLIMQGVHLGANVNLENGNFFSIDFSSSDIGGQLILDNAQVMDKIEAYGMRVRDQMTMKRIMVKGKLFMHGIYVGSRISLATGEFYDVVSLKGSMIGGDLFTDEAIFHGMLDMHRINIKGTLIFNNGIFDNEVRVDLAEIYSLEYKGTMRILSLDLTGTHINKVILKIDGRKNWPDMIHLQGFTYSIFIGKYTGPEAHQEDFFYDWLKKLKEYTPQPYSQCAKVLRESGQPEKADDVIYAGKEEERLSAWRDQNISRWFWLSMLKMTIGYGLGLRYFRSLWLIVMGLIIGTIVCMTAKNEEGFEKLGYGGKGYVCINCLFYSLDMMLPLIQLRDLHDTIDFPGWQRYYFHFHRLAGWILASFIVAGLTGIAK